MTARAPIKSPATASTRRCGSPKPAGPSTSTIPTAASWRCRFPRRSSRAARARRARGAGSYHGGPAIHVLVGNIDADPRLEILVTSLANGPLYAWRFDGTPMPGWPALNPAGPAYPALGQLSLTEPGLEVFSGHIGFPGGL